MATKRGFINLISLLLTGALYSFLATGITTIRPGDQLNVSNNLVSANGIFTLGFFNPGDSKNTYLGIWYTNKDATNRVWVANRDTPIFNNSTVLTIDTTGKLVITSTGDDPITLNSDQGTGNAIATLEDTGNFVLTDEIEKRVLWQSFDYPTDSLLPGMKLGVNLKTGRNWTLTSWLSYIVPASGPFTLSWDPTQDSEQLVIRRHGVLYWTSGVLANQAFEFMPGLNTPFSEYNYSLSYVSNQDEKYLTFSVTGSDMFRWTLTSSGNIEDGSNMVLNGGINLFCYGYESDNGCTNATLPECRSQHEKFEIRAGSFVGTPTDDTNSSLSISDCWARCWNDCGCVGFTNINDNGTGCRIWSGYMEFQQDESGGQRIYLLVSANPTKG
ncbi:hypothetical protein L1049_007968 [Liquidambar formosana]|uniref:non-specific serine/threonine protein kinase n=1 Tax=Liquidambar formosana TaxID=63359 RepID=A0AAP0X7Y7_LIQFO